jgi:hypothetical protein
MGGGVAGWPMMVVSAPIVNERGAGNHRGSEMANVLP